MDEGRSAEDRGKRQIAERLAPREVEVRGRRTEDAGLDRRGAIGRKTHGNPGRTEVGRLGRRPAQVFSIRGRAQGGGRFG